MWIGSLCGSYCVYTKVQTQWIWMCRHFLVQVVCLLSISLSFIQFYECVGGSWWTSFPACVECECTSDPRDCLWTNYITTPLSFTSFSLPLFSHFVSPFSLSPTQTHTHHVTANTHRHILLLSKHSCVLWLCSLCPHKGGGSHANAWQCLIFYHSASVVLHHVRSTDNCIDCRRSCCFCCCTAL